MNTTKKILILTAIVILIIVVIVIIMTMKNKVSNDNTKNEESPGTIEDVSVPNDPTIKPVTDKNEFYIIKNVVDNYYIYIEDISDSEDIENNSSILYSFLDDDYITAFGVTQNNLLDKLGKYSNINVVITKMDVSENSDNISTYFVYGMLRDNNSNTASDFTLMVTLDLPNYTFSIAPYEYMSKIGYDKLKEGDVLPEDTTGISDKTYNTYEYETVSDETVVLDYMKLYSTEAIYKVEESYNLLDGDYRDKRFGSLDKYKQYVQANKDKISNLTVSKYSASGTEGNMQYTAVDVNGNTYYINEKGIMNFTMTLDNYTIKTELFNTTYSSSTDEQKAALDLDIFVRMLNTTDYDHAYAVLDNGFKNNYFKIQSDFENYVKQNFFKSNILSVNGSEEVSGVYKINATLSSGHNVAADSTSKTFLVKLGSGTDFTLAFNVE